MPTLAGPFWRPTGHGLQVLVKVQPKSHRPGLQGLAPDTSGMRLRIGVSAAAEDGQANKAACAQLAAALGMPASAISVAHGATSRQKTLLIEGDPAIPAARLAALFPASLEPTP